MTQTVNGINANLNSSRAPTVVSVGFNTPRQPNVAHDTFFSFTITIQNNAGQTANVNIQISPDGVGSWQPLGNQGASVAQATTNYFLNGLAPAGWFYRAVPSGTGATGMSQVVEQYL